MEVSFCTLRGTSARVGDAAASGRCANAREACELGFVRPKKDKKVQVRVLSLLASRP